MKACPQIALPLNTLAPFSNDGTSREAARSLEGQIPEMEWRVLEYLIRCGERGGTDQEIQLATSLAESTERPRRVSLVQQGLVTDSGKTRRTQSGRLAIVWRAT